MHPASQKAQNTARPALDRAAAPRRLRSPQARINARQITAERTRAASRRVVQTCCILAAVCAVALIVTHSAHRALLGIPTSLEQAQLMGAM